MRRACASGALLIVGALVQFGCGATGPEGSWNGDVRTRPDGVTVVDNPAEPLSSGALPLELEATYGGAEAPAEAVLSDRLAMVRGPADEVVVLDTEAARLVAFDAEGALLWSAGGPGEGPGQLGGASGILRGPGDELWIARRRTTVIDRWSLEGAYLESLSPPLDALPERPHLGGWIGDDVLIVHGQLEGVLGARLVRLAWRDGALGADGSVELRLAEPSGRYLPPEGVRPQITVGPGRLLTAGPFEYELREHRLDGSLARLVRRPEVAVLGPVFLAEGRARGWFDTVRAPVELSTGHWLAGARWPTNIDDGEEFLRRVMAGLRGLRILARSGRVVGAAPDSTRCPRSPTAILS